ncbi:glycosyl transferase group 1 [Desulfocucumis palustris]|uniref:Glycosyl transferase group 1 n=1 Tax=Desulfocucumis palustris TaxID=1898651 RepID=A0A2L2XF16_9FIRM|nr:glycosyltransferase family 4 protein [Desulfocucumis palustris]GBF34949.1 glycosyl transferase group 1 [Desulfocucumis palustris]
MKIGIFTDSYLPYTSGVVKSIEVFTRELTDMGHDVYIFAPSYPKCAKENRVFRFASLPAPTNPGYTLAIPFSIRLKPVIRNLKLDIIHVHSPFLLGRLGAKYAKRLGIPLVFTFHTLYDQYVHYVPLGQEITREITRRLCRDFCNGCDMVITPTGIIAKHLEELGVNARVETIPTGIEVEKFINSNPGWLRQKYNIDREKKILLFVGRLGVEKNIHFLLEAFKEIHHRSADSCLVLVGGGPEEEKLKKQAKVSGLTEKIIFTGKMPWQDVVNCYVGADIFVFASVTETQGLVIGEAKAAGLPVVAVKAFGVSEMVEDGKDGFLTGEDRDEFVEKIALLLKDRLLREKMSLKARENAWHISSRGTAKKLADCYRSLLEWKKSASG